MPELWRLEVGKRLAQGFGIVSPQGIDSATDLREARARKHATLPWERLRTAFIRKMNALASRRDDGDELEKLRGFRNNPERLGDGFGPISQSLTSTTPYYTSRFWAVLIGIDAYESHPLQGCVSDALSMKDFLIKKLEVPGNRIQCLLGAKNPTRDDSLTPSRANIVDALYNLIDNTEISWGDNIIIYYAGHGSSYQCSSHSLTPLEGSKCRTGTCPIEALCPIDRDTKDAGGKWIPDISDRELNAIFTEISRTKGHKITFIADCCHASSVGRNPDPETGRRSMRGTHHSTVDDMLRAADGRLKGFPCYKSVLSKNWLPDMGSHVCLAACRDYQRAKETVEGNRCGGIFTRRLVYILTSGECNKGTTYVGLTHHLNHEPFQTPIVYGDHINEPLWFLDTAT
ncbi:caspase domain-containing protein [Armillaria nabsnona]|nr:caspase domain-containing protein [Armillaria nabsnona]